ncbi:MAG: glucose 1-dehydrogenase [Hyphomicrobiaceae bacterium]
MRGLRDKVVIVTGAASGIGRAIALRFGAEGALVALFDINDEGDADVADTIVAAGGKALAYHVDITDRASVEKAVAALEAETGRIDVLVNNAGWDIPIAFVETDRPFWDKVIAINLYGPLNMHHVVLPRMIARKAGRIVNIASDAGRVGSSGEAVYSACKGGIIAFTKTIAREAARAGINVNCVCPGPTDTPLFDAFKAQSADGAKIAEGLARAIPFRRLGVPEDYPGTVCFLASDDAAFVTGQVISVSGGLTMNG